VRDGRGRRGRRQSDEGWSKHTERRVKGEGSATKEEEEVQEKKEVQVEEKESGQGDCPPRAGCEVC